MENLSLVEAKLQWKTKLIKRMPDVEKQLVIMANGTGAPYISEECPEKLRPLAERLIKLQVKNGEIRRESMDTSDINKIKDISKATGSSFSDVISYLVKNAAYINYEIIDARHIIKLLVEFDKAYEKYFEKYGSFPMNLLSSESRRYLKNNNNGLSNIEKMQGILEIYRPELKDIAFSEHNYDALPRSRVVLDEKEIEVINSKLKSIANGDNLDEIFSKKHEKYFKNLCAKLKIAGYSFDRFINEHTNFKYTLCFKADILLAVKQMLQSFYDKNGAVMGITHKDPYLRYKLEAAQNVSGCYSIKELLEYFNISADYFDNNQKLSGLELKQRQQRLFNKLTEIYPNKIITKGFATKYDRLYDELSLLYRRFGYKKIDEYLAANGFSRIVDKKSTDNIIYLSERDLDNYGFIDNCQTFDEINERLKNLKISYIDPYENLGIYRRLSYDGLDSTFDKTKARVLS